MGKTRKLHKGFSFANNVILENDLSLLSGRLYTDINGIVFILGLGLFISLVNCIVILQHPSNCNLPQQLYSIYLRWFYDLWLGNG